MADKPIKILVAPTANDIEDIKRMIKFLQGEGYSVIKWGGAH